MHSRARLLFILTVLISFAARIYALDRNSYWIDEMVSLHLAKMSDWSALFWDNSPFSYNLLLKLWIFLFGDGETATRSLSVLFSAAATGVLGLFGFSLFGLPGLLVFGVLHAISPLSIQYAQETRMYAQFEFFTALSLWAAYQLAEGKKGLTLYLASAAGLALTHYLGAVPLIFQSLWLRKKPLTVSDKKKIAAAVSSVVAILAVSYLFSFSWQHLFWQEFKFSQEPESHWPGEILWMLVFRSKPAAIALIFAFGVSLVSVKKRRAHGPELPLLLFWALPIFGLTAASLIFSRSFLLPRYLIFVLPPFVAWLGIVLMNLLLNSNKRKIAAIAAMILISLGCGISFEENYRNRKAPWRKVARDIAPYPNSLALFTKTYALQTPYFFNARIYTERWRPDKDDPVAFLKERLTRFQHIWILDTYWDARDYFLKMEQSIKAAGMTVEGHMESTEYSEPIFVLHVSSTIPGATGR